MSKEAEFLREFEAWVESQVTINEMAMAASRKLVEEDGDARAADAYIRYESKLDAYRFILGKFANFKQGKDFHALPDGLFGQQPY